MTWTDEILTMLHEASGDLGLFIALVALRHVENGGPGREFGVLSTPAPTYATQLHIAAQSLRHADVRQPPPTRDSYDCFTDDFLRAFSARWAPRNAANDPRHLNVNHADNLVDLHTRFRATVMRAFTLLPALPKTTKT